MTEDKQCPVCHKLNKHLDLKETNGWMECIYCGAITMDFDPHDLVPIPYKGIIRC